MMKSWPLTESQLGMFLAWNEDHDSTQYVVPVAFRLPRTVDLDRLEKAIRTVAEAYLAYRTRFVEEDGEIRQVSDPGIEIPVVRRKVSVAEAERALAAYPLPHDYFKGPLFRAEILETPEDARLILDWAHVIVDGTAGTAFFNAVAALYNGADGSSVGTEQVDIFAYAEAEKKGFASADYRAAAEAAKARFAGRAMTVPEERMRDQGLGRSVRTSKPARGSAGRRSMRGAGRTGCIQTCSSWACSRASSDCTRMRRTSSSGRSTTDARTQP